MLLLISVKLLETKKELCASKIALKMTKWRMSSERLKLMILKRREAQLYRALQIEIVKLRMMYRIKEASINHLLQSITSI
jgi:hypothetical protein